MIKFLLLSGFSLTFLSGAYSLDFGGYVCEQNCNGQIEGFRWAKTQSIREAAKCPTDRGDAFEQGCKTHVADPDHGTDLDDNGKDIKTTPETKEVEKD